MSRESGKVDLSGLKVNQACIVTLTLLGFVFNAPVLAVFVAVVMLAGTAWSELALFKQFYRRVLKPAHLIEPNPVEGPSAPHEFAQLLGGLFLAAGSILLFTGFLVLGWILAWIVILLAAVNLFFGFCAGCFLYYQFRKLGVPGFRTRTSE
jgi:Domain of unknown function (DUF4395)